MLLCGFIRIRIEHGESEALHHGKAEIPRLRVWNELRTGMKFPRPGGKKSRICLDWILHDFDDILSYISSKEFSVPLNNLGALEAPGAWDAPPPVPLHPPGGLRVGGTPTPRCPLPSPVGERWHRLHRWEREKGAPFGDAL